MQRYILLSLTCLSLFIFKSSDLLAQTEQKFTLSGQAQGTTWSIVYFSKTPRIQQVSIDSLLTILDSSLSIYNAFSTISKFNESNVGISIDEHLRLVVKKSLEVFHTTGGRFDITVKPLVEAWGFAAKHPATLPDSLEIRRLLSCVGSRNISFSSRSVLAKKIPCAEIDVNGIAQGYTVDCMARLLRLYGIQNYVAEIGGEIRAEGGHPDRSPFRVGIETPNEDVTEPSLIQRIVQFKSGAITTSGSYRKFYESNGKRISHIIDPKTGYSAITDLISVTVYAKDAITADAYDNAILAMGLVDGMRFVEKHKGLAAFFIFKDSADRLQTAISSKFRKLLAEPAR